ncbi:unnamed protein product [Medioppia subpectinata]|uniref:Uncharacterized protein n=1 Tax=Medioppia subpectinata TaxID=1979941 RepID=A0A7R9KII9_9ACAR|nr:unnamed protein product [Medioppia subpectinata]CAG2104329.1 unnamed protein product [Medioppia subpectinata]
MDVSRYFGNLPKDYNKAVHGPYYPFRYYGKRETTDTPLADVKVGELVQWFNRRNVHPVAVFQAMMRAFYRFEHRFVNPRFAYPGRGMNMKLWSISLFFFFLNYKTLRTYCDITDKPSITSVAAVVVDMEYGIRQYHHYFYYFIQY